MFDATRKKKKRKGKKPTPNTGDSSATVEHSLQNGEGTDEKPRTSIIENGDYTYDQLLKRAFTLIDGQSKPDKKS